jgi:hypothetical protein
MTTELHKGMKIEVPRHYSMWIMGYRFGTLTQFRRGKNGCSDFWYVKIDHPLIRRRLKLWRLDWPYINPPA